MATGTVAVLAGGPDIVHPPENAVLHGRIAQSGCLVSEMPCGFQPRGRDVSRRNRLISGNSLGMLVVEAARRSGTLTTARQAVEQNRSLFAIPGNPLDPRAEGTNYMLKTGATLVTEPGDILEALSPMTGHAGQFREVDMLFETQPVVPVEVTEPDEGDRARVLEALGPAPVAINDIVRTSGLDIRTVRTALIELDLAGLTERHGALLVSLLEEETSN